MPLPKSFTTVTTFSKFLAMFLFILFPFIGFYAGMEYQEKLTPQTQISIPPTTKNESFQTKEICESKTGKGCEFSMCDYTPPGKTLNDVCVKNFKKGWYPSSNSIPSPTTEPTGFSNSKIDEVTKKAKSKLSQRLQINESQISIISAKEVTWSDGSMGCPKPGYVYTQSLIGGYKVVLLHNQHNYDYHSGANGDPVLCEK